MNKQLSGFVDFIRKQGVVGLAVGLAIGTQATETTKALVDGLVNPIVNFLLSYIMNNPTDLNSATWTLVGEPHLLVIKWGLVLSFFIKLAAVAAVIYFVIMGFGLDKLDKKEPKK